MGAQPGTDPGVALPPAPLSCRRHRRRYAMRFARPGRSHPHHSLSTRIICPVTAVPTFPVAELGSGFLVPRFFYTTNLLNRTLLLFAPGHSDGYCRNLKRIVPHFYQSGDHLRFLLTTTTLQPPCHLF